MKVVASFSLLALMGTMSKTNAFVPVSTTPSQRSFLKTSATTTATLALRAAQQESDAHHEFLEQQQLSLLEEDPSPSSASAPLLSVLSAVASLTMIPSSAFAAGPDWGIFEGRTGSLLHPLMMGSLLAYSIYTAFLGFQYRRQRTIGDDIKSVQSELNALLKGSGSVSEAIAVAKEADDKARISMLEATAKPLEVQVNELKAERKELSASGPRDKHFGQGALLAFLGTAFAIEGPLNTYARAGKLFPGPHLYAGAGLVVCWALASACVPSMIKGNDAARTVHIGANLAGIGLFGWQVISGWPILLKVIEKTNWP